MPKFSLALRPLHASLLLAASLVLASVVPARGQSAQSSNALAAAPETPFHREVVEDMVARVNDRVISTSDFDHAEQELEQQARQRNWQESELDDQKKNLLRDLIDNQLLLSKGKQLGITGEAEAIRQLDEIRKQNHLDSMEDLEKAAEQQGVSFADFKASIQNRVITSSVIRQEVGQHINITDGELREYYKQHQSEFTKPESVTLSELMVATPDPDNATQVAEAKTKVDDLESQLKAGKDFATLAKANSAGSTAGQGGALGQYERGSGKLPKVMDDAVFPLSAGQYTSPIRTRQGWIILKVDGHQPGGEQPFEQVRVQVEDALGSEMMTPALRQYLQTLREQASIDIKPGYVDAGASANEQHFLYSAYQPPTKKKKKPVRRTRFNTRGPARSRMSDTNRAGAAPAAPAAPEAPAAPAGVPSLADVAAGKGNGKQVASGTQKAGKREKVRFGQAPRETLPGSATREVDAGASQENGNASPSEAIASDQQPQNAGGGAVYGNGESADEQQAEVKKVKTRYLDQSRETGQQKKKRVADDKKRNAYPFTPGPATSGEVADRNMQSQPLGLAGDTTKKAPKPKPTSKTRLSNQSGKNTNANPDQKPAPATMPIPISGGPQSAPGFQEPSSQAAPGTGAPVQTQSTPTGSGDPLGPPTPAPQQNTQQQPPQ